MRLSIYSKPCAPTCRDVLHAVERGEKVEAELAALKELHRWHKWPEEQPPMNKEVLARFRGRYRLVYRVNEYLHCSLSNRPIKNGITHWCYTVEP